jgi:hypothetical protein
MAEWLELLVCIQEVPNLNLGPETGCSDRCFCYFFQALQADARIVP